MKKQQEGYDLFSMQDFLDNKGMVSLDDYLLRDNINNPNYLNPLRFVSQMQQPQQVNYNYQPMQNQPQYQQQPTYMR